MIFHFVFIAYFVNLRLRSLLELRRPQFLEKRDHPNAKFDICLWFTFSFVV